MSEMVERVAAAATGMTIERALWILCTAHTRDDDRSGFVVEMSLSLAMQPFSRAEYIAAWEVMRNVMPQIVRNLVHGY